jgi:hypothetical protein
VLIVLLLLLLVPHDSGVSARDSMRTVSWALMGCGMSLTTYTCTSTTVVSASEAIFDLDKR